MSAPLVTTLDPGQRVDILGAHTAESLPPLDFVLPGLLAGTVGMIAAPGATGKGFFVLQSAISVAAEIDIPICGAWPVPAGRGEVCILMAEDPVLVLEHRIRGITHYMSATDPRITHDVIASLAQRIEIRSLVGEIPHILGPRGECTDTHKRWRDYLMKCATSRRLMIIDTVARFHGADENANGDMTMLLQVLEAVAKATGCAIVLIHHTSKAAALNGQGGMQQAARGASALVDNARWALTLSTMSQREAQDYGIDEDRRGFYLRVDMPKKNYGVPEGAPWLRRAEGGVLVPADLQKVVSPPRRRRRDENGELVETYSLDDFTGHAELPARAWVPGVRL